MGQISAGIRGLRTLVGRVYLIDEGDGATLIDASVAPAAGMILRQLGRLGARPRRIIITHAHPDHIGGLAAVAAATGAEVWAGAADRAVVEGAPVPTPDRAALRGLARLLVPPPTRIAPTRVARELAEGDELPGVLGGVQVLHTPGHSPGHISLWQPARRILICGDVIMHLGGLRLPVAAFTPDMAANIRAIGRLAALAPELVCFGHGPPLAGGAAAIAAFARKVAA